MNVDLSTWNVAKVTTLAHTFGAASKFAGTGLNAWDTTSVTTLQGTFASAGEMNSDLSKWSVAKVTTLEQTFNGASKFAGTGLSSWSITKVASMTKTFDAATVVASGSGGVGPVVGPTGPVNSCNKRLIAVAWAAASDPGGSAFTATTYATDAGWIIANACVGAQLDDASFKQASWDWVLNLPTNTDAAEGKWGDIGAWDVSSVKDFKLAFSKDRNVGGTSATNGNPKAAEMNSDLSKWNVAKVVTLAYTFDGAAKFAGTGLAKWDVAKVASMAQLFDGTSLSSCSKRKIADVWRGEVCSVFPKILRGNWAAEVCKVRT